MITVTYNSNNSGGGWWLEDSDWIALYDAGWQLRNMKDYGDWSLDPRQASPDYLGAITTYARKDFSSMREAVEEWERITGQRAAEPGCYTCCGQPHYFSGTDADGNYVNGPEIVISSDLSY